MGGRLGLCRGVGRQSLTHSSILTFSDHIFVFAFLGFFDKSGIAWPAEGDQHHLSESFISSERAGAAIATDGVTWFFMSAWVYGSWFALLFDCTVFVFRDCFPACVCFSSTSFLTSSFEVGNEAPPTPSQTLVTDTVADIPPNQKLNNPIPQPPPSPPPEIGKERRRERMTERRKDEERMKG